MTNRISNRDYEALSAYLDGELAPKERTRLESRMLAQPELRAALQELRKTRQILRAQVRIRPRRNFTLTPEMVGGVRPRRIGLQMFPVFGMTAALATLALVVTVVFGLLNNSANVQVAYGPQAVEMQMDAPAAEAGTSEALSLQYPEISQETQPVESLLPAFQPTPTPDMGVLGAVPPGMGGGGGESGTGSAAAAESLPPQEFPQPESITQTPPMSVPMEMAEATALSQPEMQATPEAMLKQAPLEPSMDASREALPQESALAEEESPLSWWTPLRIFQVLLGGLVLLSGLAALFFWILERA